MWLKIRTSESDKKNKNTNKENKNANKENKNENNCIIREGFVKGL
jgi:hypothetical protein